MKTIISFLSFYFVAIGNIAKASIDSTMLSLAYQGSKNTARAIENATGKLFSVAIACACLKEAGISFTCAEAIDGSIIRLFENGNEYFRFFLSKRECWQGSFGVSGKARAMLETASGNSSFSWKQQGSKNYWFSENTESLLKAVSRM
jgi:hypothetical protein